MGAAKVLAVETEFVKAGSVDPVMTNCDFSCLEKFAFFAFLVRTSWFFNKFVHTCTVDALVTWNHFQKTSITLD